MVLSPIIRDMGHFEIAAQLDIIRSYMSFIRMAMRIEKPYPLLKRISNRHNNTPNHQQFSYLRTMSDISLLIFFMTDHPLFFYKLGYLPMSKGMLD